MPVGPMRSPSLSLRCSVRLWQVRFHALRSEPDVRISGIGLPSAIMHSLRAHGSTWRKVGEVIDRDQRRALIAAKGFAKARGLPWPVGPGKPLPSDF